MCLQCFKRVVQMKVKNSLYLLEWGTLQPSLTANRGCAHMHFIPLKPEDVLGALVFKTLQ